MTRSRETRGAMDITTKPCDAGRTKKTGIVSEPAMIPFFARSSAPRFRSSFRQDAARLHLDVEVGRVARFDVQSPFLRRRGADEIRLGRSGRKRQERGERSILERRASGISKI